MPKISFLIPSKNRLHLLEQAVESILNQNYQDLEIVISDNASEEDYQTYVDGLEEGRIVYQRQSHAVSVTENWRRALALSSGDYVHMLGDDDALAPNFIDSVLPVLCSGEPDLIYVSAYHYCYPKVLPAHPSGYLAVVRNAEFLQDATVPFSLPAAYARELATSVLDFRARFSFNAQHFLLKTSFVKQLEASGGIYQSPYPDTFAAIAGFTHAQTIVVVPIETVIIGISPNSFGFFYFTQQHDKGYEFLASEQLSPETRQSLAGVILPGDRNNTNWLVAAEAARRTFMPAETPEANHPRYRLLQMMSVLRDRYVDRRTTDEAVAQLAAFLTPPERISFDLFNAIFAAAGELGRGPSIRLWEAIQRKLSQHCSAEVDFIELGRHRNIRDAVVYLGTSSRGRAA